MLNQQPQGRRLNRPKLVAIGSVVVAVVLVLVYFVLHRPTKHSVIADATAQAEPSEKTAPADIINAASGSYADHLKIDPEPTPPTPSIDPQLLAKLQQDLERLKSQQARDTEARERLQAELDAEKAKAKTPQTVATTTKVSTVDPDAQRLKQEAREKAKQAEAEAMAARESPIVGIFHSEADAEDGMILGPQSLKPGTPISCTLDVGINSEHQTVVVATVRSPVYDSLTGTLELIPVESTLTGTTRNLVLGEETADVTWDLLTVGNHVYDLGGAPGGDLSGESGIKGDVNHKWGTLFASIFVRSSVAASSGLIAGIPGAGPAERAGGMAGQSAMQQTGNELTKTMNVNPTIRIAPGTPCSVTLRKPFDLGHAQRKKS